MLFAIAGQAFADPPVSRMVAITGTDGILGPGQGTGVTFSALNGSTAGFQSINNAGQVLFVGTHGASLAGAFLWSGSGNVRQLVSGSTSPDGSAYTAFLSTSLNNAGQYAFRDSSKFYAKIGSSVGLIAAVGAAAPGAGGATFSSLSTPGPSFNEAGQTVVLGTLTGSGVVTTGSGINSTGIWSGQPGSVSLTVRRNDPTNVADTNVGAIDSTNILFNNNSKLAFTATLQSSTITIPSGTSTGTDQAVISNRNGSMDIVARRGGLAPTGVSGEAYKTIGATSIAAAVTNGGMSFNDAGNIVFSSSLRNSAGADTVMGLFTDVSGSMTAIARGGNALPTSAGMSGVSWGTGFSSVMMNHSGKIAFVASGLTGTGVTSSNNAGIFTSEGGVISTIARAGSPALGTPTGVSYSTTFTQGPIMNAAGQVAWLSQLTGTGVTTSNNSALYATDPQGVLYLIARTGNTFEVAPGDVRTVKKIAFISNGGSSGEDGRPTVFNDSGMLLYQLDFTDLSSSLVVTQIPSPSGTGLLALAGLVAARRRRSR
jgi:hypothetical protein